MNVYPEITEEGLVFTLDPADREELTELLENNRYDVAAQEVYEYALCNGFSQVNPEDIGALTSAPILADCQPDEENGIYSLATNFYWFPRYMLENPLETLRDTGRVVFTKA